MKQRGKKKKRIKSEQPQGLLGQYEMPQHLNHRSPRRRRQKEKGHEKILEKIAENFPKRGKEIVTQVQETQRVPNRINPRQNTPRHILIKLTKIKNTKNKY